MRKVRRYAASPARIGNSRGYRMDAALFQEHPELREGAFEAAYIGTGTLLLRQRHARRGAGMRANDDADPIVAAYLAWTERVMAQQPALLRPLTRREFELAEKLVAEVEIDLEKDRLPDDFVLP